MVDDTKIRLESYREIGMKSLRDWLTAIQSVQISGTLDLEASQDIDDSGRLITESQVPLLSQFRPRTR